MTRSVEPGALGERDADDVGADGGGLAGAVDGGVPDTTGRADGADDVGEVPSTTAGDVIGSGPASPTVELQAAMTSARSASKAIRFMRLTPCEVPPAPQRGPRS
jgi:hypothetical protein